LSPAQQAVASPGAAPAPREGPERTKEPLRLMHHHPGYVRIQASAFSPPQDDGAVLAAARAAAETAPGFRSWSQNPKTGSVVVEYDPDAVEPDDLLKHIAKGAGFRGVENATRNKMNREELVNLLLDTVQDVNQVVSQLTGDRADLREVVPAALAATSVVSFVLNDERGRLPQWSSCLYHSYRVFMQWHRREARLRERAARQREESLASADAGDPGR